jgi:uncharacterized protein (TIGR00159 family)
VVWYLVYRLLLILKGTRTVPMAVGLLIIFVVYQVTQWLELITLYSLLHTFLSSIVIFAVVVFQDDIRRALFRVGRFARFGREQEAAVVDEVIKGATSLASKRIGALIVFEREAKTDDFIEAGTNLDAAITGDIIYAIFIPAFQNPVHDGAIIVRNFRIHKAGAFLPLTRNPNVEKTLGTRHRAAIGITEETDALALVVSEERGTISLCKEGAIEMGIDPVALRAALLTQFSKPKRQFRFWMPGGFSTRPVSEGPDPTDVSKDPRDDKEQRASTWPGSREQHKQESSVQRRVATADAEE